MTIIIYLTYIYLKNDDLKNLNIFSVGKESA